MSEYIIHYKDAETLYEHMDFPFELEEYLREPIVRCRDCKHYEYWEFRDGRIAHDCARGGEYVFDTEPNGYCAWGERR